MAEAGPQNAMKMQFNEPASEPERQRGLPLEQWRTPRIRRGSFERLAHSGSSRFAPAQRLYAFALQACGNPSLRSGPLKAGFDSSTFMAFCGPPIMPLAQHRNNVAACHCRTTLCVRAKLFLRLSQLLALHLLQALLTMPNTMNHATSPSRYGE